VEDALEMEEGAGARTLKATAAAGSRQVLALLPRDHHPGQIVPEGQLVELVVQDGGVIIAVDVSNVAPNGMPARVEARLEAGAKTTEGLNLSETPARVPGDAGG
jgi:hypothetical protein